MILEVGSKIILNNRVKIPIFGLGTWALDGRGAYKAVLWAIDAGYRMIDTATVYANEREIGDAIKDCKVPREDIFLTTKVWNSDQGYDSTLAAFDRSLKELKTSYVDLYLIHWPVEGLRSESWKALEKIYSDGKARAIGVSNYTVQNIKELLEESSTVPTVNQVEFSPFLYQKELLDFCTSQNIFIEAYCPLTRARKLDHPTLKIIGRKYNKSAAQVLIRWGLQHNIIEIPKAGSKDHIYENINVFDFNLNDQDMEVLDNLNEDYRVVDRNKWINTK
jgi:diketogulonate reductase-like aldo/keto reductase